MSATFQTIPTANPAESAFVLTVDDNLITPATLPARYTTYANWLLGQRDRTVDTEWDDYVFVDTTDAAPGRRAFIFGKSQSAADIDTPFETYFDSEFHRWPTVVTQQLKVLIFLQSNPGGINSVQNKYFIKSATEAHCVTKVEHFQNALPWEVSKLRHPVPITDDIEVSPFFAGNNQEQQKINDCLHGEMRLFESTTLGGYTVRQTGASPGDPGYTIPATNFTDWAPYVLRDTQKQSRGMWVREKVTVFPPINAKRKML